MKLNNSIKRILCLLLTTAIAGSLGACSGENVDFNAAKDSKEVAYTFSQGETYRNGVDIEGQWGADENSSGGDYGIVATLYDYLTGTYEGFSVSELRTSVENHLLVFAAEKSRATNTVVDLDEYMDSLI